VAERGEREEEQRVQRAVTAGVLVLAGILGTALVSGGAARVTTSTADVAERTVTVPTTPSTTGSTAASTTVAPSTTAAATTTTVLAATEDPGALPQTDEKPVASGATFEAGVQGLWQAVQQDRPELGMPFFFPKSAYLQVKAIADPATDYEHRLVANYEQDIHSLHAQLGAGAAGAQLTGIDVPDAQAVLVQPGEESNKLSYWRVYGSTVHYTEDGQSNSFAVTSLISWRGEWYVVHLGEIR
jgi:hypothetical protein